MKTAPNGDVNRGMCPLKPIGACSGHVPIQKKNKEDHGDPALGRKSVERLFHSMGHEDLPINF